MMSRLGLDYNGDCVMLSRKYGIVSMFDKGDGMAKRRGQRKGWLSRQGASWMLAWREDVRSAAGEVARHRFYRLIAPASGPGALTKKQAERIAWDEVLSKLDQVSLYPGSLLKEIGRAHV
jgi:hypothetical protein